MKRSFNDEKIIYCLIVSLMTISSLATAGGCDGVESHDHDAKKKMERGA